MSMLTGAERAELSRLFGFVGAKPLEQMLLAVEGIIDARVVEVEQRFMKWLVEDVHYPLDISFETAPPVDHDLIAEHWRIWDKWSDITPEEARAIIRDEAGQ